MLEIEGDRAILRFEIRRIQRGYLLVVLGGLLIPPSIVNPWVLLLGGRWNFSQNLRKKGKENNGVRVGEVAG